MVTTEGLGTKEEGHEVPMSSEVLDKNVNFAFSPSTAKKLTFLLIICYE